MRNSFVLLLLACAALAACTARMASGDAYRRGRFVEASEALESGREEKDGAAPDKVQAGINASVDYLLGEVAAMESMPTAGLMPVREALARCDAALAGMPAKHPRRAEALETHHRLENLAERLRADQRARIGDFGRAAVSSEFTAAISALGDVVAYTRTVGGTEPAPATVLALAESAMAKEQYDAANALIALAGGLRRAQQAELGPEAIEQARLDAALHALRPAAPSEKPKPDERAPAAKRAPVAPTPAETDLQRAKASERLQQAKAAFKSGDTFSAISGLDQSILQLGEGPASASLLDQRKQWQGDRQALVDQLIGDGEQALGREDPKKAVLLYQRVLLLAPDHELAKDRLRKLKNLEKLQGADGGSSGLER